MLNTDERSRTDTYTRPVARSCVANGHSGTSLRTHFQPDVTIVEVRGAVDACNAEPLIDYVADLASPGRPLILDLYGVDFFSGDGRRALVRIAETASGQVRAGRWCPARRSTDCCLSRTVNLCFPPQPRWRRLYSS